MECRKYDLFSARLGEVTGLSRGSPRESGHFPRVSRFLRDNLEGRLKAVESVVFNCPSFSLSKVINLYDIIRLMRYVILVLLC